MDKGEGKMNDIKQAIQVAHIVGSAIMAAGKDGIPSGHLYAMLMGKVSLEAYQGCVNLLKRERIVSESNHVLTWIATA